MTTPTLAPSMPAGVTVPTTADLLNLISSLKAKLSTMPASTATVDTSPGGLAKLTASALTPQAAIQQAQDAQSKGKSLTELPYDTRQMLTSLANIQATTGPTHRGILGSAEHDFTSIGGDLVGRLSDLLSRGQYASANVAHAVSNDVATAAAHPSVGSILKSVGDVSSLPSVVAQHPTDVAEGLGGEKKGNYAEVIQHIADLAKEKGNVKAAEANPGIAHVNPILKSVGGLVGDIALDPTTYLGSGLIGKVLHTPEYAESVDKALTAAKDTKRIGSIHTATDTAAALGTGPTGVYDVGRVLKKGQQLTPDMIAHMQESAKPLLTEHAEKFAQKAVDDAEKDARSTLPKLDDTATKAQTAAYENKVRTLTKQNLSGETFESLRDAKLKDLQDILEQNLRPDVAKKVGITFAGQRVASIPVGGLEKAAAKVKASSPVLTKGMDTFDSLFRSSKGLNPVFQHLKLSKIDGGLRRIWAHNHILKREFGHLTSDDLTRVFKAYTGNLKNVKIAGKVEPDLTDYFGKEIKRIQASLMPENGSLTNLSEFNRHLPDQFKLKSFAKGKTPIERAQQPDDWLERNIKEWYTRPDAAKSLSNPAHILQNLHYAHETALSHKALWQTLTEHFGHATEQEGTKFGNGRPLADRYTRHLQDKFNYQPAKGFANATTRDRTVIPYTHGHVFDPETARGMGLLHDALNPRSNSNIDSYMRTFDKAQHFWKSAVTKFNPGYHERNLFGETFNNWLAGVKDVRVYRDAARVLHNRGAEFLGNGDAFAGATKTDKLAANALLPNAAKLSKGKGPVILRRRFQIATGRYTDHVSADELWHLYVDNGLKTGFLTTDIASRRVAGNDSIMKRVLATGNDKAQQLTENVEDYARMAHFIDGINKSTGTRSLAEAAEKSAMEVRKYHFDYTDFTRFEKTWMSRIFPFYKWTRKNIPLMLQMTFAKPGKIVAATKVERMLSGASGYNTSNTLLPQGDALVPSWLKHEGAFPVDIPGISGANTTYDDVPLPWNQGMEAVQGPKSTIGQMVTPALGLPFTWLTGKTPTGQNSGGVGQTFSNASPYTKIIENLLTGKSQGKSSSVDLAQFLTGAGLIENTPNRMFAEAKREQTVAAAERKKQEVKAGTFKSTRHPGE